jgi:lipid-binding SYLF domain-containing protein
MRKMTHWVASLAVLAGCLGIVACSTTPPGSDQQQLMNDSNTCYSDFTKDDPTLDKFVKDAYGYAIFPSIGKGAIGIGGAYGRGVVYQEGTAVGWTDVSQGSLGVQLGGQTYSELIVFKDKGAMDNFKSNDFALSATASAVAAASGAAATTKFDNGVAVFVRGINGLMFEASVGGQSFGYRPLNQDSETSAPPPPPPPAPAAVPPSAPQQQSAPPPSNLEPPTNNTSRPPSN